MRLEWSPLALEELDGIARFIGQDRPDAAEEWIDEVFEVVRRLNSFPESGRVVPEVRHGSIREVIHGRYRIIYRVESVRVSVLTVRHSRQLTSPEDIPECADR